MPLLDHFRPPLSLRRDWHAFHNAWATTIAYELNRQLPEGYFAEPSVQFGIEIDVATFEERARAGNLAGDGGDWTAPAPTQTVPMPVLSDLVEVHVLHDEGGPILAAAIELVSPSNKDRPAQREAFVSKCASYLQGGVGLVLVDVVTTRTANLHDGLMARFAASLGERSGVDLDAVSYRPVALDGESSVEVWHQPLVLGQELPTLPLWLRGALCFPLDLGLTYERTCRELRLKPNGT